MVTATQQESSTDGILKLLQSFTGTTKKETTTQTTSPSTTTAQTALSQDTMNGLLKSALESNQGLAAVAGAQNQAGMYNSTTNSMMTNDLLSRMTTDIAAKGAPTVTTKTGGETTQKTNVSTPGLMGSSGGTGSSLGAMALLSLGKGPIDRLLKGKNPFGDAAGDAAVGRADALSSIGTELDAEIASFGGSSASAMASAVQDTPDYLGNWITENGYAGGAEAVSDVSSNLVSDIGGGIEDIGGSVVDIIADAGSAAGDWISDAVDSVKDFFSGW